MKANKEVLQIISNETIDSIHDLNIVTPSIYKSIFTQYASSHNTNIDKEDKLTDLILNEKISLYKTIQTQTIKNATELSDSTNKAISAIKDKDESKLNEVLEETILLRKEIEKLKEAVYKDELTHAHNRKWLNDTFLNENYTGLKAGGVLAIIDLNYFKIINDTYGHIVGDKVLIFIANSLKKTTGNVIRYGGDEFIIIFSNASSKDIVLKQLNGIRENIISKKLKSTNESFRVSFSFGISPFKQDDELTSIIELADKEMYKDKIKIKKRITGI